MLAFISFYYAFMGVAYCLAIPFLCFLSFKQKYKDAIKRRFFIPTSFDTSFSYHWFHACSFGEVQSLSPIIHPLEKSLDTNAKILLTTATKTGYNCAKTLFPNCTIHYMPFEIFIPFWLHKKRILTLTILEAEFWLMPLFCAKKNGARTFGLNTRISSHSFHRYLKFKFFYVKLFSQFSMIFAQSKEDKKRLLQLGAKNIQIFGNLKLAQTPNITAHYSTKKPLWIIASTHCKKGISEESLILEEILKALDHKDSTLKDTHFLFAPRHPERFLEVENILNTTLIKHNLPKIVKTSENGIQNALQSPFILLDSIGALNNLYAIAKGVILGGSFLENIGGHNPIEPAFFNTHLISGVHIFNQKALFSTISDYYLCEISALHILLTQNLKCAKITQSLDITHFLKQITKGK